MVIKYNQKLLDNKLRLKIYTPQELTSFNYKKLLNIQNSTSSHIHKKYCRTQERKEPKAMETKIRSNIKNYLLVLNEITKYKEQFKRDKPNFFKNKQRSYSKLFDLENPTIPETWIIYRKTVLKVSQKQIADLISMELPLYCKIENGQWKGIPIESWKFIFSQLIRDLCLLTKKDMKSLFPEFFCLENFSLVSQKETLSQETTPKNPLKNIISQENSEAIYKALKELSPMEEDIIKARFALGPYGEEGLLEEVASRLDLTRERVRQIEVYAMEKLFQSPFLRSYFKVPKEYLNSRRYHKNAYDDGL